MRATVRSGFTSTVTGSWAAPLATARARSSSSPSLDARIVDRRRLDDDQRRLLLAGERGLEPVVGLDDLQVLRERLRSRHDRLHPERGQGEGDQDPGRHDRREVRTPQHTVEHPAPSRPPPGRCSRWRSGTRALFTLSPSLDRSAGSTVSDPSTAIATTMIVAIANELKIWSPVRNIPAIAAITVRPETSTARPEVAAAASSAAVSLRPAARSSRSRLR